MRLWATTISPVHVTIRMLLHITLADAFKPGSLMDHDWLYTSDCTAQHESSFQLG